VTIEPLFSARDNRFVNATTLKLALALQETLGGIELLGLVPELAEGVFDLPTNFAILQLTPELTKPIDLWSSQPDPESPSAYPLTGFDDASGSPILIAASSSAGGGGSGGGASGGGTGGGSPGAGSGGSGGVASGGGGSGGGGATNWLWLAGLAILWISCAGARRARLRRSQ